MRHLDTPGEDMGGRLSRQRGGGAGRGGSPRAAGQPPSRHFRLTAPRPSVLSHSTNDDPAAGGHAGPSSSSGARGHHSPVSRRGSGLGGSADKGGRSAVVGRDSSSQYASSSSSSRRAVTGSSSRPPISYEDSLDAEGIDDTITPPLSTGGGGAAHARRSSAHQGGAGAYIVSPSGKMTLQGTAGNALSVSARLHVPGLRAAGVTSAKQQTSTSNSERSRSSGRDKGAGRGGKGGASPHTRPTSPGHSDYDSVAAQDMYNEREGPDGSGSRCRSAPPADTAYSRSAGIPGEHGTPRSHGYVAAVGQQPESVYDDDQRPAGGRRCVRSPGPAAALPTPSRHAGPAAVTAEGRGSPRPSVGGAEGGMAGDTGAAARQNVVRRPVERGPAGQQHVPDDKAYLYGDGAPVLRQQRRRSSGAPAAPAATPRIDSSGIIDRSKFILENVGVLTDYYDVDSGTLGQGSYGSVAKARKKHTGQMRAIKTISKSQVKNLERFRQEIAIMKELDHPNVVKLFETFEDHRNIYLVMELCSGGELFDRIISEGRLTEKQAAVLMKQMLSAVHYLHSNHIMHRDLKPENFLFLDSSRDSPLKIIDFGLSCRFKPGEYVSTKAGTPYYVAPQVLQGKYDYRCDAWSLGVILYILLCGYPPFYGETDAEVLTKVKAGVYSFSGPEWKRVSEEARDLIRHLIKFNPQERFTAEQALQHPWITTLAQNSQNVALPTTLMSNLKAFRAQNKLKKAALTVIAQHMSEKDINHLRQIFMTLDVDNSGTLSVQEIREGLKRLGWTEIPLDLQAIIEEVDSDRSGHIDYTEFVAATMDKKLYMKEDVCWAAFRVFDLDGNGKISQDELKKVLGMPDVETAVGRATIDALLNEVDLNGDGEIDFDEFMHMMRKKDPPEKRFDLTSRKTVQPANFESRDAMRRHTLVRPALNTTSLAAANLPTSPVGSPNVSAPASYSSTTGPSPSTATTGAGHLPATAAGVGGGYPSGCATTNVSHPSRTLVSPGPQMLEGDCSCRQHHAVGGTAGGGCREHQNY